MSHAIEKYFSDNILLTFFIGLILIISSIKIFQTYHKWRTLPPGPWGFPIVGHLPLLGNNLADTFITLAQMYGDIFYIRMGCWPTVVLNSRKAIKEALVEQPDIFSDRPKFYSSKVVNDMRSLGFGSYTPRWRLHKKIALNVLQNFAARKRDVIEQIIVSECKHLNEDFLDNKGEAFDPHDFVFLSIGSIIYQVCYGIDKNCRKDEGYVYLIRNTKILQEFAGGNLIDLLPWLRFVLPAKAKEFVDILKRLVTSVDKGVSDHMATYDENHLRDLTDGLIQASNKYSDNTPKNCGITKLDIFSTLQDFLGGGFDTTSTTLEWIILYLGHFPKVQRSVQSEIDDVLGTRAPTLQDMGTLPYTEATILEVMRIAPVAQITIPHATTRDTTLRNYTIMKESVVLCNVYATSMDEETWHQPKEFLPERFLDKRNRIIKEKVDLLLTFSTGRRRCPGEFLARMELFMFVTNVFQKCSIEIVGECSLEGLFGLNYKPKPYRIKVVPR